MIDGLFVPYKAELIKKIPLSIHHIKDALFWLWTQSGQYSYKSEFRFLKHKANGEGVEETQADEKKFWHSIWDLRIHNKIKIFLWKACHNSIPTKTNLMRWHITNNPLCAWCLLEEESPIHSLWSSCSGLDSVWSSSKWSFYPNIRNTNFEELLSWILKNQSNLELSAMIT